MLTFNGKKMAKSEGTGVTPREMLTGDHPLLTQAYSAMTIRFFMLQAHYRSTLDFSNDALQAAEKGLKRLMVALNSLPNLPVLEKSTLDVSDMHEKLYAAMNDDFNSPIAIAHLFEAVKWVNLISDGKESISESDKDALTKLLNAFVTDILGLKNESENDGTEKIDGLVQFALELRQQAKLDKNYAMSDSIRDRLKEIGFEIKDGKDGSTYTTL